MKSSNEVYSANRYRREQGVSLTTIVEVMVSFRVGQVTFDNSVVTSVANPKSSSFFQAM